MAGFTDVIKKHNDPHIESLRDDFAARKNKDFFWPTGTQVYCGRQGSGKTISAVKHLLDIKARYPKAIIVSNIALSEYQPLEFKTEEELALIVQMLTDDEMREEARPYAEKDTELPDPLNSYIHFKDMDELAMALTQVNNGYYGVVYVIDEIHTYFNALDSKNIPMYVFTEISQQRKQRKLIIGTSQLFLRMAKPLREQCDNLVMCKTFGGFITTQKAYDGMSLTQDYDGNLHGDLKKVGWFFHTRKIRSSFDTYQKVVSSSQQYEFEQIQRIELLAKKGKKIKVA